MIQGSTPTHTFTLPIKVESIDKIRIVYAQNDKVLFVKNKEDCTLDGNCVSVKLSQENTLSLMSYKICVIQIRVLTVGGDSLVSNPISVPVEKCYDKEVL